jgi:hypothetical protein
MICERSSVALNVNDKTLTLPSACAQVEVDAMVASSPAPCAVVLRSAGCCTSSKAWVGTSQYAPENWFGPTV